MHPADYPMSTMSRPYAYRKTICQLQLYKKWTTNIKGRAWNWQCCRQQNVLRALNIVYSFFVLHWNGLLHTSSYLPYVLWKKKHTKSAVLRHVCTLGVSFISKPVKVDQEVHDKRHSLLFSTGRITPISSRLKTTSKKYAYQRRPVSVDVRICSLCLWSAMAVVKCTTCAVFCKIFPHTA